MVDKKEREMLHEISIGEDLPNGNLEIMEMNQRKRSFTDPEKVKKLKDKYGLSMKDVTDGYHTFEDLYDHRAILSAVIFNTYKEYAWKSWQHHDGTMFDGMFIVGVSIPNVGDYSYHYNPDKWDMFDVPEVEFAPEYDGHKPEDIARLLKLLELKK